MKLVALSRFTAGSPSCLRNRSSSPLFAGPGVYLGARGEAFEYELDFHAMRLR